jgi:hypothetical protein
MSDPTKGCVLSQIFYEFSLHEIMFQVASAMESKSCKALRVYALRYFDGKSLSKGFKIFFAERLPLNSVLN